MASITTPRYLKDSASDETPHFLCSTAEMHLYTRKKAMENFSELYEELKITDPKLAKKFTPRSHSIDYVGNDIIQDSYDLVAAVSEMAPEQILDYSDGELADWAQRHVAGLYTALEKEEEQQRDRKEMLGALSEAGIVESPEQLERKRLAKKKALVEQKIIYPSGKLGPKGHCFLEEIRKEQGREAAKQMKYAIQEIDSRKNQAPQLTAKGKELVKDLPSVAHTYDAFAEELLQSDNPLSLLAAVNLAYVAELKEKKAAQAEEALDTLVNPSTKASRWHSTLRKVAAVAGTSLMILGAAAGMVGGDDDAHDASDVIKNFDHPDTQSRAGYNAENYNYDLPLDQLHPIKPIIKTSAKERHPAIYEDQVVFGRYDSVNETWSIWLKNLTSGNERKLFNDDLYDPDYDNTAIFGNRVISGNFGLLLHDLNTNETNRPALGDHDVDLWEDNMISYRLHSRNPETSNYKADIFLYNFTTGNRTKLTNSSYENWQKNPTIYRNLVVWEGGSSYLSMDLKTGEVQKLNFTRSWSSLDLFEENLIGCGYNNGGEAFLYDLDTGKTKPFFSSRRYIDSPKIYGDRIVFAESNNIAMMELDKWFPQFSMPKEMTATPDHPFSHLVNASHPTSPTLTFADDTPLFDIDPNTGDIKFTPSAGQVGTHYFNITVKDKDNHSMKKQTKLIIGNGTVIDDNQTKINQPPVFTDLPDKIDVRVPSKYKLQGDSDWIDFDDFFTIYDINTIDSDDDEITYRLLPTESFPKEGTDGDWVFKSLGDNRVRTVHINKKTGELQAYSQFLNSMTYKVKVEASDGKATVNKTADVTFHLNNPPAINSIYPSIPDDKVYKVIKDRTLDLGFKVSDPDGDRLTTRLEVMDGGQFRTVATAEKGVHTWEEGGILRWDPSGMLKKKCRIAVSDDIDETYSDEFSVDILLNKIKSECPPSDYGPDMSSPSMEPGPGANIPPDSCIEESTSPSQWDPAGWPYWSPLGGIILGAAAVTGTYKSVRRFQRAREERLERTLKAFREMEFETGNPKPRPKKRRGKARKKW